MTVKELGEYLLSCDEDILDFEVGVTVAMQVTSQVRLSARCRKVTCQENADISAKIFWLKARTEEE